uniref:Uncharacterized protein n=1 Tax=Anguilla anguilla TaxID=7936 RepID=A0A0E9SFF3_ANGAN
MKGFKGVVLQPKNVSEVQICLAKKWGPEVCPREKPQIFAESPEPERKRPCLI